MKRYAWLWMIAAAGLVLGAPGKEGSSEKTLRRRSVLRCDGYDIVFLNNRDYVSVQMHEPFRGESLPVEEEADIPELKGTRLTGSRSVGFEPQIYAAPVVMNPPTVGTVGEERDEQSLLDWEDVFRADTMGEENLPSWGWLTDKVLAEELADKRAAESKLAANVDAFLGYDFLQGNDLELFGDKEPASGGGFWGSVLEAERKELQLRGESESASESEYR